VSVPPPTTAATPSSSPLHGVRVIDLTTTFMGPYCTLLLGQMGADVVKVEAPEGDIVRHIGPERNAGMGTIFLNANHGKRSIALDLKDGRGRQVMDRLLGDADIFVTNMRPRAVAALDLGFDRLSTLNPRLVYCTLTGFGSAGPYRDFPAYDDVIQAVSGLAVTQGDLGPPAYVRTPIADKVSGLMGLAGVLAALVARNVTGTGQAIEVPMFETMAEFMLLDQLGGLVFDPPAGPPGYPRMASPYRKPYRTQDGYLGVVVYTDRQWRSFFELVGHPELADDPRFRSISGRTKNIDELYQLVEDKLAERSNTEWMDILSGLNIPCVPVLSVSDLLEDPHLDAVDFFQRVDHPTEGLLRLPRLPIGFSAAQLEPGAPAPRLGEHGPALAYELGYSEGEVDELIRLGVLGAGAASEASAKTRS
jgi:crotonobetainyl-CoA:carnitine CoA-transferase CaiB-like acyl-CoA transferase